jgi:hypothetical protein
MISSSSAAAPFVGGNGGNGYGPPSASTMFGMPPPGAPASASAAAGYSQAVSRSDEFLSCAKTAVKLAKRRNQQQQQQQHNIEGPQWWSVDVEALHLHSTNSTLYDGGSMSNINPYLEESIELLRGMHGELQALEGLVKRRGHTNDPTDEIQACTDRLQRDTQELLEALNRVIPPKARGQSRRHYQLVSDWIKGAAQEQGHRLRQVLKTRAAVLAEQAQRRKMFTTTTNATTTSAAASMKSTMPLSSSAAISSSSSSTTSAALSRSNPLFTIPVPPTKPNLGAAPLAASHFHRNQAPNQQANGGNSSSSSSGYHAHGRTATAAAAASAGYGSSAAPNRVGAASAAGSRPGPAYSTGSYYGYGYGGNPYGGSSGGGSIGSNGSTGAAAASGMRQRRAGGAAAAASANAASHDSSNQQQQEQERLLVRQQERQAQERLREARQAESSLVELGTLFGKMTHLISAQGETVAKIEDDVEAAVLDINAGHAEIQTLYGIKKGNRGLILKTFGLLIFFIVFMRLYKSK